MTDHAIVFFDLETGGRRYEDNILQLCMKSGQFVFNCFITPTRSINPDATKVNGLSISQKKLFQNGVQVQTFPRQIVFNKILEFLNNLKKSAFLSHIIAFLILQDSLWQFSNWVSKLNSKNA